MSERHKNLIKEIFLLNAPIVCLQELDALDNAKLFYPKFKKLGYDCIYKDNPTGEGVAIFYDNKRFEKIDNTFIEFPKEAKKLLEGEYKEGSLFHSISDRMKNILHHSVALFVLLKDKQEDKYLSVSTCHLYWSSGDFLMHRQMQVFQSFILLNFWEKWLSTQSILNNFSCAKVLCGDFNSGPEGGVYKYLSNGFLSKSDDTLTRGGEDKAAEDDLKHNFNFKSAYSLNPKGEPEITNFTNTFSGTLDYIFYSIHNLVPCSLLRIPERKELEKFLPEVI